MNDHVGYVVIEFNQAGGQPELATDALYDTSDEAADKAVEFTTENRALGRRERYSIGTVSIEEDW